MFTGIIETLADITEIGHQGTNLTVWFSSPVSDQLTIDQSVSHNGICLTIDALRPGAHRITAVQETIQKTTLGQWQPGKKVNIERCLQVGGRLDGHIVQGHVDSTATCISKTDQQGSWLFRFTIPAPFASLIVEKGSIALNGTSLTIFDVDTQAFSVAIIPYTYDNTTIHAIEPGDAVNIEYDLMGKYVQRIHQLNAG